MGKRVIPLRAKSGSLLGWLIDCPGCRRAHVLDHRRVFNGDECLPTFREPLLIRGRNEGPILCHAVIYDGKIEFFSDSLHRLAGTTVELPEFYGGR